MSQGYRPLDEQQVLDLRNLARRVQALERNTSGAVSLQSVGTGATVTATATPGTAISGVSITITRPGRYGCLAIFDMNGSATGWTLAQGAIIKNGTEVTPNIRAIMADTGAAVMRASISVFQWQNLVAGDVLTLGAWKNVAAGTLGAGSTTYLNVWRTGPT